MEKHKVVVAGHVCLDMTPEIPVEKVKRLDEVLAPGKLIPAGDVTISTGGAVANTGLAMKILGADVSLMGKVGKDDFGKIVLDLMKKYGCESGMIVSEDDSTSYSVVMAIPGVDRFIFHNPGANDTFHLRDLDLERIQGSQLFHFGYPPIMASMYREDGKELLEMFHTIHEMGVLTSMDMAAVSEHSEAGGADWAGILSRVLPYTDFFVPSVEELLYMLDREKYRRFMEENGDKDITEVISIQKDVKPLADTCIAMGAGVVLIKCGAPGLYYRTAGQDKLRRMEDRLGYDWSGWYNREGFEESYAPEKVRSGTGAGDTTIGAFLMSMLEGYSLDRCLQLAAATGASCVETYDALSGLKSLKELEKKIDAGWEKQYLLSRGE